MNKMAEFEELLSRWETGSCDEHQLARLTDLLSTPEFRSELRDRWILDESLGMALSSSTVAATIPLDLQEPRREANLIELTCGIAGWGLAAGLIIALSILWATSAADLPTGEENLSQMVANILLSHDSQ